MSEIASGRRASASCRNARRDTSYNFAALRWHTDGGFKWARANYSKLSDIDPGLASRWKVRTRDNPRHLLKRNDIDFIMEPIVKSTASVTEKQGEAILEMLNASIAIDGRRVAAAKGLLIDIVQLLEKNGQLNMTPLAEGAKRNSFRDFLGQDAVGKSSFTSSGTGISYAPFDYISTRNLAYASRGWSRAKVTRNSLDLPTNVPSVPQIEHPKHLTS
ncbi:hypothetical protein [Mesorhizobium sp. CN2-181]|uniref:hypothetical protein n=1 Tax=Mesorhizobium yinganensis TaxID=3157707 RepID=UPI0032B74938